MLHTSDNQLNIGRLSLKACCWLSLWLICSLSLPAQRIELSLDSTTLFVGSPLTLSLRIRDYRATDTPSIALKEQQQWNGLEVLKIHKPLSVSPHFEQQLVLTAWDSGLFRLSALPLKSSLALSPQTSPLEVRFVRPKIDPNQPFKDIKPPTSPALTWQELLPYLLLGLMVVVVLLAGLWWLQKRKRKPATKAAHTPSLSDTALGKLREIESMKLWQRGEGKLYFTRLTDVMRTYIEKKYEIPASDLTSAEILLQLERKTDSVQKQSLAYLFELADKVKFAKHEASQAECEKALEMACKCLKEGF